MGGPCAVRFLWIRTHTCHLCVASHLHGTEKGGEGKAELLRQESATPPLSLLIPWEIVLDAGGSLPGSVDNRGCGGPERAERQQTLLILRLAIHTHVISSSTRGPWLSLPQAAKTPWGYTPKPMLSCPRSELLSPSLQTVKNQDPAPPGLSWPSLLSPHPPAGRLSHFSMGTHRSH